MILEYNARFREEDLINDMIKKIREKFPVLDVPQSRRLATDSLNQLVGQGNMAIYEGLVNLGVQYATKDYEQFRSPGLIEG